MWGEGFTVKKLDDNEWYLLESKNSISEFKSFDKSTPTKPPAPVVSEPEEFWVAPYEVKNSDGLRPWQINSVSKIISAINKWGAAIDGSDVGVGKCHSKGTKIRMYDGSLKHEIGQLGQTRQLV